MEMVERVDPTKSEGLPAIARADARVLILGTLPGAASLACGEYYANRGNAFWPIMKELVGAFRELSYEDRCSLLKASRLAVWDVYGSAKRPGSLDSAISDAKLNDFEVFFRNHNNINLICFNGYDPEQAFLANVLPNLSKEAQLKTPIVLPSTSSTHTIAFEQKLSSWRSALMPELENI